MPELKGSLSTQAVFCLEYSEKCFLSINTDFSNPLLFFFTIEASLSILIASKTLLMNHTRCRSMACVRLAGDR